VLNLANEKMLTIDDLSRFFQVDRKTILAWAKQGRIPEPISIAPQTKRWHPSVIEQLHDQPARNKSDFKKPNENEEDAGMSYFGILDPISGDESLMTPREVCSVLYCSFGELFSYVRSGRLTCVVTEQRHKRFRTRDVFSFQSATMNEIAARVKLERFCDRNPGREVA